MFRRRAMAIGWYKLPLPRGIRQPLDAALTLWQSGLLEHPRQLLAQLRERAGMQRLQRALFYQRYATGFLLAHEVGIFDALHAAPRTSDELAQACNIDVRPTRSLLTVLRSEGLVTRRAGRYALTGFAKLYLPRQVPGSLAGSLDLMAASAASFGELRTSMRTLAIPSELDIFSPTARPAAFLEAVNGYLHWAALELLRKVELPPIDEFIVGSMGVSFSARLLERQPRARVSYGCLEHLVTHIPRLCDTYRVPTQAISGMHAHGGDPQADRWGDEAFDLVFLTKKMILRPEERMGQRFVEKAFDVLRPGGKVVLWETVHPNSGPTPLPHAMEAVLDLATSPAAPVLTVSSISNVLGTIGFERVEIVPCLGGQTTFVVANKPRASA